MVESQDILDNIYFTDPATETLLFFKSKGVSKEQLNKWQQEHPIIYPWSEKYSILKQDYNRRWVYFPLAIVMAKKVEDIQWAFKLVKNLEVPFSIRSGGHDWNGLSLSAGIVIDLSRRDYIKVLEGGRVELGAGVHIGPMVKELEKYSLVIPSGTCQNVGITGLTLGGGLGMITRHYGLTIDSLLEARIILADGSSVTTSKKNFPDLFWALRGAGPGNFGIVTDLAFQGRRLSHVYIFDIWIPREKFRKLFKWWQKTAPYTDVNLSSEIDLYSKEEEKPTQVRVTGEYSCSLIGELPAHTPYCKDREVLLKLLEFPISLSVSYELKRVTYTDAVRHYSSPNPNYFFQNRSAFFSKPLDNEGISIIEKYLDSAKAGMGYEINAMGGNFSKIAPSETAFPWRDAIMWMEFRSGWRDPLLGKEHIAWVQGLYTELEPYYSTNKLGVPQLYYNFADLSLGKTYPLSYWYKNTKRLIEVKQRFDPENLFRRPQGVPTV